MDDAKKWKITTLILVVVALFACWQFYEDVFAPNVRLEPNEEVFVYVHSGDNFDSFLARLEYRQTLKNVNSFRRLAKLFKLDEKLKAGKYRLESGMNNLGLLKLFKSGRQTTVDVTLKYADSKEQLAGILSRDLEPDSTQILHVLQDSSFIRSIGMDEMSILTLFIPNTYNFYWNTSAEEIVRRFLKEYNTFWNKTRQQQAAALQLTPREVGVLASIVQKETNKVSEMPRIAQVYLNRMHRGMPLQADPTILYVLQDKSIHRVLKIHTFIESPFNTYKYAGLPPGPICMPHPTVIDAVLKAESGDYLYFCAKSDLSGQHVFARTLQEHQHNARLYQKKLDALSIQ